jgi:hypothetical protein
VVEEQQVLALDVEDQRLRIDGVLTERAGVEQAVEQERGVGGLRGDTRDPGDVDVRAARAVEELEVDVDRLVVTGKAGGQPFLHRVEVQGLVALLADRLADDGTGQRGHEDLGLDPGQGHLRGLGHLAGEDPVLDQEHVGVEASPLVAGPHLRYDAVDRDRLAAGRGALGRDDVVELQVVALR